MENRKLSKQEDQNQQQEHFCLPDFFQKEFPNLSKFLEENLLKEEAYDSKSEKIGH
jgi:hypothetical protein